MIKEYKKLDAEKRQIIQLVDNGYLPNGEKILKVATPLELGLCSRESDSKADIIVNDTLAIQLKNVVQNKATLGRYRKRNFGKNPDFVATGGEEVLEKCAKVMENMAHYKATMLSQIASLSECIGFIDYIMHKGTITKKAKVSADMSILAFQGDSGKNFMMEITPELMYNLIKVERRTVPKDRYQDETGWRFKEHQNPDLVGQELTLILRVVSFDYESYYNEKIKKEGGEKIDFSKKL